MSDQGRGQARSTGEGDATRCMTCGTWFTAETPEQLHCRSCAEGRTHSQDVTGWSVRRVLDFLAEKGADPESATLDYEGCGSHNVELEWTAPARTQSDA